MHEDNQSTIEILRKGYSSKLPHVPRTHRISLAWTSEAIAADDVELKYCESSLQKGDVFTKALDRIKHSEALEALGVRKRGIVSAKVASSRAAADSAETNGILPHRIESLLFLRSMAQG